MAEDAYRKAGVNIDAGEELVQHIKPLAAATRRPEVLSGLGGFGGVFSMPAGYKEPVLVSGTDGVGTKLLVAQTVGKHGTIGIDLVGMCVNDIVVSGAEPLYFLDYFATGKLDPSEGVEVVAGIAEGCRQAGCALIGGETAEMPGMYAPGHYDLAGFAVGIVEKVTSSTEARSSQEMRSSDYRLTACIQTVFRWYVRYYSKTIVFRSMKTRGSLGVPSQKSSFALHASM